MDKGKLNDSFASGEPAAAETWNHTHKLEEMLKERTRLLEEKTFELETLTNNICGGVQICAYDDNFTLLYVSTGFEKLVGYDREELKCKLHNRYVNLVYPPDLPVLTKALGQRLKEGESFSLEYRIICGDGRLIWVLDKGIRLPDDETGSKLQCILMDITTQKEQEEELRLSEKRYEIALVSSELTMFEYDILTKELIFYNGVEGMYQLPSVVSDGPETLIRRGTIEPVSVPGYREMYRQIHAGAPKASCLITTKDAGDVMHDYELTLTTIYDLDERPIRAIGVRKNVTQMMRLQKERQFGRTLVANRTFICEANITKGVVVELNQVWASEHGIALMECECTITEFMDLACELLVAPEHKELLRKKLALKYLSYKFGQGENLVAFSYKCRGAGESYVWHEGTVNMIRDERTNDLIARYYEADIHEKKTKEQKALEEQRLYESMTARAILAYEVNVTRNTAIRGYENWDELYGIKPAKDYTTMIESFSRKAICFEDGGSFLDTFRRENVLKQFYSGRRQLSCQYRKRDQEGKYRWACCMLHMFEDPETGDVRGFSYVEDIDEQKKAELALKYSAEHDLMTGLYNKVTTSIKIEDFLLIKRPKKMHAFLMIDIDYFKQVNDQHGHAFGDAVLCELAARLRKIFRGGDVVGRIGGDEFCVFMKNVPSIDLVCTKAGEVCERLRQIYRFENRECKLSASVGIAVYPSDGKTEEELYHRADEALYQAKKNGRDRYTFWA